MVEPSDFLRRSPVRRAIPASAQWIARDGAATVARLADAENLGALAIADLSPLPRLGFKGRGTIAAMKRRGVIVEEQPNKAFRQSDGGLCLVLGAGEILLLGAIDGSDNGLDALEHDWRIEDGERSYPVPRRDSHAWFAIRGEAAPALFAKLCAVDLRPHKFADLAIAQTSVARLNAIVLRADQPSGSAFHLLADSASSLYLLDCLLDAAEEFGGRLIGLEGLQFNTGRIDGAGQAGEPSADRR